MAVVPPLAQDRDAAGAPAGVPGRHRRLLLLSGVTAGDSYAAHVLPGMLVLSVGNGLSLPVLAATAHEP
ncbi:putative transmembrane efflux protein [[Actinomadura] parvosata subsp. kistnae]|nr:putative transmembrane efflux protein [Actinomadura parvosata subsp. kistnae]